jgi:hypothetical protein
LDLPIRWQLVPESQLVIADASGGVSACNLSTGASVEGYNVGNNSSSLAFASITPATPVFIPGPFRGPISFPIVARTYLYVLIDFPDPPIVLYGALSSVLMAAPSQNNPALQPVLPTAVSLPSPPKLFNGDTNGLAVYQKHAPNGAVYLEPPPVYLYVLGGSQNSASILRYQMTNNSAYTPAGTTNIPGDATFVSGQVATQGGNVPVLTTDLTMGLACSAQGVLAASDSSNVWLFDAETGGFSATANNINLANLNLVAYTLAYGPDGNLYILAGSAQVPDTNGPTNPVVLQYSGPGAGVVEVLTNNLLSQFQISGPAMTVGGTAEAPIIYLSGTNQYGEWIVCTFNAANGQDVPNSIQYTNLSGVPPQAFGITDFYVLQGEVIHWPL